ncbi:hypothetical protein B0H10DRAFT_2221186 [Mycena sp. CBHHK59/15]|nr:hypothetical protein B0H10DRAFT_2221186 [Mycena sp. CBHHK59/15]
MSDSRLYTRLLLPKGHGYPLFHPQPYDDFQEIRSTGTEIGDVVYIRDGCLDVVFNICHAANDPVNRFGVPAGFEQIKLGTGDVAPRLLYHRPGSDISSTKIIKRRLDIDAGMENNVFLPIGAGAVVEITTSSKETAVLLLPDGASRWDLRPLQIFRDYALKHTQSWYAFLNGPLGRMVGNGDLYLVTGFDKSSSWSVAALDNHSEDCTISLKLKAAQVGSAGASCAWEWESASSFTDSGPRLVPGDEPRPENQTVFVRGFKVAIRSNPLTKGAKALSIVDSKPTDILAKSGSKLFTEARFGLGMFSGPPSTHSSSGASDDEGSVEYFCGNLESYHPAHTINEFLLDSYPDSMVAATHDDEWASVLEEADEEVPDDSELLKRIFDRYRINITLGGVCLEGPVSCHVKPPLDTALAATFPFPRSGSPSSLPFQDHHYAVPRPQIVSVSPDWTQASAWPAQSWDAPPHVKPPLDTALAATFPFPRSSSPSSSPFQDHHYAVPRQQIVSVSPDWTQALALPAQSWDAPPPLRPVFSPIPDPEEDEVQDAAHDNLDAAAPKVGAICVAIVFTDWIQRQQASSSRKLNVAQAAKEAGQEYARLSEEERAPYKRRSQAAKEVRERELNAYMRTLTPNDIKRENAFRSAQRKAGKSWKSNIKDPNAPRKPLTAYFMFLEHIRAHPELVRDIFGDETETTKQSVLATAKWRSMTDDERKPFLAQAEQKKMEYEATRSVFMFSSAYCTQLKVSVVIRYVPA